MNILISKMAKTVFSADLLLPFKYNLSLLTSNFYASYICFIIIDRK